jgi:excisionase family DNA binding protein
MSQATRKYVSVPEAGRRLGRSPRSVQRLISRGQLTAIVIPGTHARVSLDEVEAFVPAKLRAPAAIAEVVRQAVPVLA